MAGVKGKSGGARPNSGGKRAGAGRKPKAPATESANQPLTERSMLQLLQDVALGRVNATTLQVRAAIAAVQYTHTKRGDGGIKEGQAGAAKVAAKGRFSAVAPPLKLVKGK